MVVKRGDSDEGGKTHRVSSNFVFFSLVRTIGRGQVGHCDPRERRRFGRARGVGRRGRCRRKRGPRLLDGLGRLERRRNLGDGIHQDRIHLPRGQ